MNDSARFAYLQARLQAHHATLPSEVDWDSLLRAGSAAQLLQTARESPMRPWAAALSPEQSTHVQERLLREAFRDHVRAVARWAPREWNPALNWLGRLADLPAMARGTGGRPAPSWLHDDPAMEATVHAARDRPDIVSPAGTWLQRWRQLAPREATPVTEGRLRRMLDGDRDTRRELAALLRREFRRGSFGPDAAIAHLLLVLLTLQRLGGALTRRMLFPDHREGAVT